MDKHPIPRQITTFEFKLIGILTLRQFLYLVIFLPLAYIFYALFPIPYLNIILALGVALVGVALAFVKIQERSLEEWIKNLVKSLSSPTIYIYRKNNPPPDFLKDIQISHPEIESNHIESRKLLSNYLSQKKPTQVKEKKGLISSLFFLKPAKKEKKQEKAQSASETKRPFLSGVVKSSKLLPLPGILVYIKDQNENPVRLMKTNPHGVFATFRPLQEGNYFIEAMDPTGVNQFDRMEIRINEQPKSPIEIIAKSL